MVDAVEAQLQNYLLVRFLEGKKPIKINFTIIEMKFISV